MTRVWKWSVGLLAAAFGAGALYVLAYNAIYGAWYGEVSRYTWTRLYPICWGGEEYEEVLDPLTPDAERMFAASMKRGKGPDIRVYGTKVYARLSYREFDPPVMSQVTSYMLDRIAKTHGATDIGGTCIDFGKLATLGGTDQPKTRSYYPGEATYADDAAIEALGLGQGWWVMLQRLFENRGKELGLPPEDSSGEAISPTAKAN